jgi:hypothetical protein
LPIEDHFRKYNENIIKSDFHKEHVNHEGSNYLDNCVPSCIVCNSSKARKQLNDWYNEDNPIYSEERLNKILKWINDDYALHHI